MASQFGVLMLTNAIHIKIDIKLPSMTLEHVLGASDKEMKRSKYDDRRKEVDAEMWYDSCMVHLVHANHRSRRFSLAASGPSGPSPSR